MSRSPNPSGILRLDSLLSFSLSSHAANGVSNAEGFRRSWIACHDIRISSMEIRWRFSWQWDGRNSCVVLFSLHVFAMLLSSYTLDSNEAISSSAVTSMKCMDLGMDVLCATGGCEGRHRRGSV